METRPPPSSDTVRIPLVKDNVVLSTFGQMELPILVDTGATLTMVSTRLLDALGPDLVPPITETSVHSATTADGQDIDILGKVRLKFMLGEAQFDHVFFILPNLTYWAVLGTDFFTSHRCHFNYNSKTFEVNTTAYVTYSRYVAIYQHS